MVPLRYPILAFATLAVVVVGYSAYAARVSEETVERLARLHAERTADLLAEFARRHDELAKEAALRLDRSDGLVLDMLAAVLERSDLERERDRSPYAAVLGRHLKRLSLDRALLFDRDGSVLLDVGRPARPGKRDPTSLELREDRRLAEAVQRYIAGGPQPPDRESFDPLQVEAKRRLFRRVGDAHCLVLVRSEATLERLRPRAGLRDMMRRLEGDPAFAWVRLIGEGGAEVAATGPRTNEPGVQQVSVDAGRYRLDVGVRLDEETLSAQRRARLTPWLVGGALLLAGGAALALVFRQQHAALSRERELRARAERERRLGALGSLAAGVAHEIKNPLNTIRLSLGRLRRRLGEEDAPILDAVGDAAGSITQTTEDFMNLARAPEPVLAEADAAEVAREAAAQVGPMASELGRALEVRADEEAACRLDRSRLREALVSLLRNALQASHARVDLRVARTENGDVRIEIDDDGPGVPAEQRSEIFDLFFTTKATGTGLGLPLAHRVAEEHGGSLEISDAPLGGARLTLTLPCR